MPSRKRNQGKARKAKAAAASIDGSREQSSSSQRQEPTPPGENNDIVISGGLRLNAGCKHGFRNDPSDICRIQMLQKFINVYYGGIKRNLQLYETVQERANASLNEILSECCEVFTDTQNRELALSYLVSRGTDMVLRGYKENKECITATTNAVTMLEGFSSLAKKENMGTTSAFMKGIDAISGCERTTVKFYHERSQCSCLDKHRRMAAKTQKKMGVCHNCNQSKVRSSLMLCGSCRRSQYCSRQCQTAHWQKHKEECKIMSKCIH